jgi:hypothetical protein
MRRIFGVPGALSRDCSLIQNHALRELLQTRNVGPFRVTGLARLLDDLEAIFGAGGVAITPIGGVSFVVGWLWLAICPFSGNNPPSP